jgi:phosphohistidine phosphatase
VSRPRRPALSRCREEEANMDLVLIRHAIAADRDFEKWPDDRGRPLTKEGAERFQVVAQALSRVCPPPDETWSSPLRRAWQTAQILEQVCGWPEPQELRALEPDRKPSEAVSFLKNRPGPESIAIVGHEPSLHGLLSRLVVGTDAGMLVEIKKGGAAMIHFEGEVRAGTGLLLWLLPPRLLLGSAKR